MKLPALRLFVLILPFAMGGCSMLDWADEHMPVIGDRCENWQCFTESGRQQSEVNHLEIVHGQQPATGDASTPGYAATPSPGAAPAGTPVATAPKPQQPPGEPTPADGAYKYVPRAPTAPGSTPFDGNITPLPPAN